MAELRREEEHARRVIERTYGVRVSQFDDGTEGAMHDLMIEYGDGTRAAVEITADADGDSIALWRLLNEGAGRWIEPSLVGGWSVAFYPQARAKRVRSALPTLLRAFEDLGVRHVDARDLASRDPLRERLGKLCIASAFQSETDYPGSIYPTIELPDERTGAMVGDDATSVAGWVGEFLRSPQRADVLGKLRSSGLDERHAFVILAPFSSATFEVLHPLMDPVVKIPSIPPTLPADVSHVWVMSSWASGRGFHWHPARGWSTFETSL